MEYCVTSICQISNFVNAEYHLYNSQQNQPHQCNGNDIIDAMISSRSDPRAP